MPAACLLLLLLLLMLLLLLLCSWVLLTSFWIGHLTGEPAFLSNRNFLEIVLCICIHGNSLLRL